MKKFLSFVVTILIIFLIGIYYDDMVKYVLDNHIYKREVTELITNDYSKTNDFLFVQHIDHFYPKNKTELLNALYTILDSGMDNFSFFCDESYLNCEKDIAELSNDKVLLSSVNNFVSPYNSYNRLYITMNSLGKINIDVDKLYSADDIEYINKQVKAISQDILNDKMHIKNKIKAIHDYIINNASYDEARANSINSNNSLSLYDSHKATGVLKDKKAICSGYTDLMSIFLDYLEVPNFKVSTDEHIWNAVFLDNKWYHLDLTWDDPVTSTKEDLLLEEFFLIDTKQLEGKNTLKHLYNKDIYLELK